MARVLFLSMPKSGEAIAPSPSVLTALQKVYTYLHKVHFLCLYTIFNLLIVGSFKMIK